jgi:DNA-binding response OmpR family regulator
MNGYQLGRALRERFSSVVLIALTGYGQESDASAARTAGFDSHCTKPITLSVLLDEINSLTSRQVQM